jgi:penicillin-binding protein 1A
MARRRRSREAVGPRRRWIRWLLLSVVALVLAAGAGLVASALYAFAILPRSLPSVTALERFEPSDGTKVYDENDELITEFHVERRIFVPLAQIPRALRDAVIATEDARFYSHFGVDPTGIARAVYQNFRRGRIVEGGSTITQQLAKVLFLTPDKSLERKLKEAALAVELERRYSKDRILELYLNQIYFGHGAFGVEAAARTFFGKGVRELNLSECALLAGLPKAPALYSPFDHLDAAKRRRIVVLSRMVGTGKLKPDQAKRAGSADVALVPPERRRTTGQYYLEYVQQLLEQQYGADIVFKGGLQVYTTLSPTMQLKAEEALRDGLHALESRRVAAAARAGAETPVVDRPEGALLAIEPQTGYIKAMVGGYDFFKSEFNRAVQARRQPGSAFKPFVYIAALETGLTPASLVDDSPVEYAVGRNGRPWKPDNYDRTFRGIITLQQALEESVNVAAVRVQEQIGIRRTVDVARRLGVESPLRENLSLALGTSDLTLLELTSAYSALANQGVWMHPTAIRYVLDAQRKLLEENAPQGKPAVSPEVAYVATQMLKGTVERGTGVAAKALGRPAAAKTGTTNDYSNAWFVGYTPRLATGVWVGYDRPRSLGRDETGSRVAVPIWTAFMKEALAGTPVEEFPIPDRVVVVPVDLRAGGGCVRPVLMAFVAGTEPQATCGAAKHMPAAATVTTPAVPRTEPAPEQALASPAVAAPATAPLVNPAPVAAPTPRITGSGTAPTPMPARPPAPESP